VQSEPASVSNNNSNNHTILSLGVRAILTSEGKEAERKPAYTDWLFFCSLLFVQMAQACRSPQITVDAICDHLYIYH
jgi:hypothetical protein